ncbi:MAG TPA: PAS domain S-box protein, partial [Ramlibacter sp.]|nr:PAS domain S-box protein [Ramlibacter sp.]
MEGEDCYRVVDANPAYFENTQLAPTEVLGRRVDEYILEPPLAAILSHYRRTITSGVTQRWQVVGHHPSGRRTAEVSATPVFDAHGACTDLVVVLHDITQLKQREEELELANAELEQAFHQQRRLDDAVRNNEEQLRLALEGAGEGVWDWRLDSARVTYSPQWKRVVGLPEDLESEDPELWFSRVVREDLPGLMECFESCLSSPALICTHEYRLRHEAGHLIWVRIRCSVIERAAEGKALRMVGTIADITDNVLLRQQLEASHTLLAQLAQQVPGALFELVMDEDGQFACTYISAMSEELFGATPDACMRDMNVVMERIPQSDRERLEESRAKSAHTLEHWRQEFQIDLPGKGLCWREVNATPMRRKDGVTVWHGFSDDITERKSHELTIRQFNEKLERRAHYDPLTGLPNRALFRDRLVQGLCQAREAGATIALLFLDLDRFKDIN